MFGNPLSLEAISRKPAETNLIAVITNCSFLEQFFLQYLSHRHTNKRLADIILYGCLIFHERVRKNVLVHKFLSVK